MQSFTAVVVAVDGVATVHRWDPADTLSRLQEAVGGHVDVIGLSPALDMWLNDEGLVNGMLINWAATAVAAAHGYVYQPYAGPVVFTGGTDEEGNTLPLTQDQARTITRVCADFV